MSARRDALDALSNAGSADRAREQLVERAVLAVALCGAHRSGVDPVRALSAWLRVRELLAAHAAAEGGRGHASGTDLALASFDDGPSALRAALALIETFEAARDPDAHRHGGGLGIGLASGAALALSEVELLGPPVARACRLAWIGEARGELLFADGALDPRALPAGLGAHRARADLAERIGFQAFHLSDYR